MSSQGYSKQQGFTLLEILVTLGLISILLSMTALVINTDDPRRDLRSEVLNFKALIALAVDEAIFKRKEIGIKFYEDRIEFLEFNNENQAWQFSGRDEEGNEKKSAFSSHTFPGYLDVSLEMEDVELFLKPEDDFESEFQKIDPFENFKEIGESFEDDEEGEEEITPDVYIFSSGEVTAFDMEFRLKEIDSFLFIVSASDIGVISCRAEHDSDGLC